LAEALVLGEQQQGDLGPGGPDVLGFDDPVDVSRGVTDVESTGNW